MPGSSGRHVTGIILTALLLVLFFPASSPASLPLLGSPGDAYVFGADSPVTATHPAPQQTPDISGHIAVWQDQRVEGNYRERIFLKDLSQPDSAEQALTPDMSFQGHPAISGNLVAWQQRVGSTQQIYYMYLGGPGPFALTSPSQSQFGPAVFGSRIVFGEGGSRDHDLFMVDLTQGERVPVSATPGRNGQAAIDGDWVVWINNDEYNFSRPAVNDVYAKNLATGELRQITTDGGSVQQAQPDISGNRIVWSVNGSFNHSLFLHDLNTGQTINLPGSDYAERPSIEGDIIVWGKYWPEPKIYMHDLTTGITQPVSNAGGAYVYWPAYSSGHVIWSDDRDGMRVIYQNRMGERARELAERYKPELRMGPNEIFNPKPIEMMLGMPDSYLRKWGDENFEPVLNPSKDELASDCNDPGCYMDLAGDAVACGGGENSCRIDHGLTWSQYAKPYFKHQSEYPNTVYARVVQRSDGAGDETAIQYWLHYPVNNFPELLHEGDWELVQVRLNGDLQPYRADYSQHGGGTWRNWDKVEGQGDRPVVYVAAGSHANYFDAGGEKGKHSIARVPSWISWDATSASGRKPGYELSLLPGSDSESYEQPYEWLNFPGRWGEFTDARMCIEAGYRQGDRDGSPGPAFQHSWRHPFTWLPDDACEGCNDENAEGTDVQITAKSPVDIHIYDSQGNHTGKNASGGIDEQIPGAAYLEYPGLERKSIIIRGGSASDSYRIEIEGTGNGICELILTAPDRLLGEVDTLRYQAIEVTAATQAFLNLDSSKDFTLSIDDDGDGQIDVIKEPDASLNKIVDFTAPAAVSDLEVIETTSGSATLRFTATGDDGTIGTAASYDLRYLTEPVTEENWEHASSVPGLADPLESGLTESVSVDGLSAGTTYYFGLRVYDDAALYSQISNVAATTTKMPQLGWTIQRVYWGSWDDYYNRLLSIDYTMSNTGTGIAGFAAVQDSICIPATVYVVTTMPLAAGDIDPSSSLGLTLKYYVPTDVGSFTVMTYATCEDDAGRIYWFPGPLA
ncbi:MAG: hypothetical protein IBX61_05970 [Thermoleophilia bacterium]|nr:hypothetical protein [Thermoleophilia bacterium]